MATISLTEMAGIFMTFSTTSGSAWLQTTSVGHHRPSQLWFVATSAVCSQDGTLNYPPDGSDYKYLLELRAEAEYYGLTGLLEQIDRYPVSSRCMLGLMQLHRHA